MGALIGQTSILDELAPGALLTGVAGRRPAEGMETELGPIVAMDWDPLQSPDVNNLEAVQTIGGPSSRRDVRMVVMAGELHPVLDSCQHSLATVAVLERLGVRLRHYVDPQGHPWAQAIMESHPARASGPRWPGLTDAAVEETMGLGATWRPDSTLGRFVREQVTGGPKGAPRDQRLYLSIPDVRRLLAVCDQSPSGGVWLDLVGFRLKLHLDPDTGRRYTAWTILHARPRPL